jgi:hypothetical protein
MSQQSHPDLIAKLQQLRAIHHQWSWLIAELYEMTRSVCGDIGNELGDPNGLTVSDINTESWDLGLFSLPSLPTWEISFYGDKLADCSIQAAHKIMKPGFSVQEQQVALSIRIANLVLHWLQIGNEARWCVLDDQTKKFIPVENLGERVKTALIAAMTSRADELIQDRSPKPPAWR